jgi:hypothetical protein
MLMSLTEIQSRLARVLDDARGLLPDAELNDMQSLVAHGEPGVALENFCTQLEEHGVAPNAAIAAVVRELARAMAMPVPTWITRSGES